GAQERAPGDPPRSRQVGPSRWRGEPFELRQVHAGSSRVERHPRPLDDETRVLDRGSERRQRPAKGAACGLVIGLRPEHRRELVSRKRPPFGRDERNDRERLAGVHDDRSSRHGDLQRPEDSNGERRNSVGHDVTVLEDARRFVTLSERCPAMIRSMNQAAEARLPRASPTPPTDLPLGWFGRIAVVGLVLIGGFVGAGTQLGLIWLPIYVPFAAVGALLAIRRPRTSIGWVLLAQGWMFAIILAPVTATVRQFADGSFDGPSGILAAIQGGSGPATFYLYAVLATIFPTGRLPSGRWGWLGRADLAAGLALVLAGFVTPMINVSFATVEAKVAVRNPIALFPDLAIWRVITLDTTFFPIVVLVAAAAVSLLVRLRHPRA